MKLQNTVGRIATFPNTCKQPKDGIVLLCALKNLPGPLLIINPPKVEATALERQLRDTVDYSLCVHVHAYCVVYVHVHVCVCACLVNNWGIGEGGRGGGRIAAF